MVSKNLVQRLKDKKLLGYVTSDLNQVDNLVIKQGKAAFAKIEKFKIKEWGEFGLVTEYFEMEDWRAEAYEKISKKLSELEQVCIKERYPNLDNRHSGTELVCLENWYKDAKRGVATMWEESYILNKEGYYKSYDCYPKVYRLEDAVRLLELKEEHMKKQVDYTLIGLGGSALMVIGTLMAGKLIGDTGAFFTVIGGGWTTFFLYVRKKLSDDRKLRNKIYSITPLFEEYEAVNNLKVTYLV